VSAYVVEGECRWSHSRANAASDGIRSIFTALGRKPRVLFPLLLRLEVRPRLERLRFGLFEGDRVDRT